MANNSSPGDTKVICKRRTKYILPLDAEPIKKRLRSYQGDRTFSELNDDCLLGIFEHLSRIDLCHLRGACARFVPLVEQTFRSGLRKNRAWSKLETEGSRSDTRCIFYHFGHLFRSFQVLGKIDADELQRLTNITSLILIQVNIDRKKARAIHSAKHLKTLDLVDCKFVSSTGTSRKSSKGDHKKDTSLMRLIFQQALPPLNIFSEMLQCSQQLRCLGIPMDISQDYIDEVLTHANQLSELVVFTDDSESRRINQLISNLKSPKLLAFNGGVNFVIVEPLLQRIKHTTSDISLLILSEFTIDRDSIKIISEMKNVQHAVLRGKFTCSETDFVSLVASLPQLNNFTISFKRCSIEFQTQDVIFTVDTLKRIIKCGSVLEILKILYVRNIRITEDDYAELADVFRKNSKKSELLIEIKGCKLSTTFDVPIHVQRADLKIVYTKDESCECKE